MEKILLKYNHSLTNDCQRVKLDYFPQVEASDLLYRIITLEDIYMPLSLKSSIPTLNSEPINVEDLIRRIDEKLAALNFEESDKVSVANKSITLVPSEIGSRILIEANPGGGKTTFCKRLVLALINNDNEFLSKYEKENDLCFNKKSLPLLIKCKSVMSLSEEGILNYLFEDLFYELYLQSTEVSSLKLSKSEFNQLFHKYEDSLTIIIDGWDEILDLKKEKAFIERINEYISVHSKVDLVITKRTSYTAPDLIQKYTNDYIIKDLSDDEIREFCKKWCSIILSSKTDYLTNYNQLTNQILSSSNPQIIRMRKNPLDLSLLLTVSRESLRLPDNKAELFKKIVDLYIFWCGRKNVNGLSDKTIRIFLAYIASYFTKRNLLSCDQNQLSDIICKCSSDLSGRFSQDISKYDTDVIISVLLHTGILTNPYEGHIFSFSETGHLAHRQMQEYLTAYAISAQYADKEFNNMSIADIFEDKYELRYWKEVIIFTILIFDALEQPRTYIEILNRLIEKSSKNKGNKAYNELLFDFIVNGIDISIEEQHRIYDTIFPEQIKEQQIESIFQLISSPSKNKTIFTNYIKNSFEKSIKGGDLEYGYANAIIVSSSALLNGISPFVQAEKLLLGESDIEIITGIDIFLIMAWCKYSHINNIFSKYFLWYEMPKEIKNVLKEQIKTTTFKTHLLEGIKDILLAGYASFYELFDANDLSTCNNCLNEGVDNRNCEIILSMVPFFDEDYQINTPVSTRIKIKYLQKLSKQISNKDLTNLVFTFSICASIGCWEKETLKERWKVIDSFYSTNGNDDESTARYHQLKATQVEIVKKLDIKFKNPKSRETVTEALHNSEEIMTFKVVNEDGSEVECEVLFTFESDETKKNYIVYTDNSIDENGNVRVFASIYNPEDPETKLLPIESDKEWKIIETILETLQEEAN